MKQLLLLRHAKSQWKGMQDVPDHDRPLAKRGHQDAKRLGKALKRSGLKLDHVLCSSALRTRQTWAHVEAQLEERPTFEVQDALYLPTRAVLLERIAQVAPHVQTLLVVGHNPALEALALSLAKHGDAKLRARIGEKFPTCALCVLSWSGNSFADLDPQAVHLRGFAVPRHEKRARLEPRKTQLDLPKRKPRTHETAGLVFSDALAQIRENLRGARQGDEHEYVHQLRVGVRRLRTALRFFDKALDEEACDSLHRELTWLFRELGALREYDVFLTDQLLPLAAEHDLDALLRTCQDQRALRLRAVKEALASPRFTRLLEALLDFETQLSRPPKHDPKLAHYARKRLRRSLRKVRQHEAEMEADDAHALHELRKEVKRLRYSCEFVRSAFPSAKTRRFIKHLSALQDSLGHRNDVAVAERLLAHTLPRSVSRSERRTRAAPVRTHLAALESDARTEFWRAWKKFTQTPVFWH